MEAVASVADLELSMAINVPLRDYEAFSAPQRGAVCFAIGE